MNCYLDCFYPAWAATALLQCSGRVHKSWAEVIAELLRRSIVCGCPVCMDTEKATTNVHAYTYDVVAPVKIQVVCICWDSMAVFTLPLQSCGIAMWCIVSTEIRLQTFCAGEFQLSRCWKHEQIMNIRYWHIHLAVFVFCCK